MDGYKTCPSCGRQNSADAQWCANCGANIAAAAPPEQQWQQPQQQPQYQQPQYQPQQPYGPQPAPTYGGARGQIISAIQMRTQTDEIMSGLWALWPLLSVVLAIVLAVVLFIVMDGNVIGAGIGLMVGFLLMLVLVYKLIKRQNEHMKREQALRAGLIAYMREKGNEQYKAQMIGGSIQTMESINQEANYKEKERSPILFAILSLIPYVNYYVLYVLHDFPYEHDRRWSAFTQQVQYSGQQLGMNIMVPSWRTLKERSFIIYLVITLILGVFIFYWYYALIKDLNEHMQSQWQFEDQLMSQLR